MTRHKKSLLERALELKPIRGYDHNFGEEELQLIQAWLAGDVTLKQVLTAKGFKSTSHSYVFLARGARMLYQRDLKIGGK